MVEIIVAAIFMLVPMYLALQAMGKFADVQHGAQAAARYAAWERMAWSNGSDADFQVPNQKSDAEIRSEIAVRVFNDKHSVLKYKSTDKSQNRFTHGLDPLWADTAGKEYLIDYDKTVSSGIYEKPRKDFLGNTLNIVNTISIPGFTGSVVPKLPTQTLAYAEFQLNDVAQDSEVYKRLWSTRHGLPEDWAGFTTKGQAAILTNSWNANARDGVRDVVKQSVPTAQGFGDIVSTALQLLRLWEPTLPVENGNVVNFGKIGEDVVPDDRLR